MSAEAVEDIRDLKPSSKTIGRDLLAGLIAAIAAIPDGMASAVLAGVNPVFGLYNLMVGTPVAALFTSSAYEAGSEALASLLEERDRAAAVGQEEITDQME